MTREFRDRRDAPHDDADPIAAQTLGFVKSWHRYPPLHDALWFRGVNLGEADEYILFQEVMSALLARDKERAS